MLEEIIQNRYAVTAVILFGIGFTNLMLQQNLLRKVIGFNIMDSAVFLLLASLGYICLLYTSPSPRDLSTSRMPSSA